MARVDTPRGSGDGTERPPGCLVVWVSIVGTQLGFLILIVSAAMLARRIDPPWQRGLPVLAAAVVAWTVFAKWWQPRMDRWCAAYPATWGAHLARTYGRPWKWKLSVVVWSVLAGLATIFAR